MATKRAELAAIVAVCFGLFISGSRHASSQTAARCGKRSFVPVAAPDTIPHSMYADSVLIRNSHGIRFPFPKNIIALKFKAGASRELRQAAIDSVCGVVVGGLQPLDVYYIKVPSDRTGNPLFAAIRTLSEMSQVEDATPSILSVVDESSS